MPQQAEDILNRLRRAGAIRAGVPARRLPGGTVNTAWRVTVAPAGEAVLRLGPDLEAVAAGPSWLRADALACEAIVLDRVRADVPVPTMFSAGFRGRPWLLQAFLPGRPLAEMLPHLDARDRDAIWRQVGSLLRRVHGVDGSWFGTPDGRLRFPDWPAMVRADAEGLRNDARRFGLEPAPFERLLGEVEAGEGGLGQVDHPTVVHSDLDARHIFIDGAEGAWRIVGVIDWEYSRYVDPWSESLLVDLLARPEDDPERAALLAGYGFDQSQLADPAFRRRQAIYRGIADGWAITDAARLEPMSRIEVKRRKLQ
jgi:aminoglycoside phosphotransferase (APT) family kinase protein